MKWVKIENRLWQAEGEEGTFTINQTGKLFWSRYSSHNGIRTIRMPPKGTIKEAKSMCENNYFWEKEKPEGV